MEEKIKLPLSRAEKISFIKKLIKEENISVTELFPQMALLADADENTSDLSDEDAAEKTKSRKTTQTIYRRQCPRKADIMYVREEEAQRQAEIPDDVKVKLDPTEIMVFQKGPKLPFQLVYWYDHRYIKSSKEMTTGELFGVVVPYKVPQGYRNFVLSLVDEAESVSWKTAQQYARENIRPYEGRYWDILTAEQIMSCKAVKAELNKVLKELYCDVFMGKYAPRNKKTANTDETLKIRYAVDDDCL